MQKKLVLFDFDGTITTKDTFPLFFKHTFGAKQFYLIFLMYVPKFILFKLGFLSGEVFKLEIIKKFLIKKKQNWIEEKGELFVHFLTKTNIIKPEFIGKINAYKKSGFEISVVSASPDIWIKPFCKNYNINFICTELLYEHDCFSGILKTKNCNFLEKKIRVLNTYQLNNFDEIIVYGDSKGDEHLMELATIKCWIK